MKNFRKYSNKTKAAVVLFVVMLIILLSTFNNLQNSKKANENINDIFKDRLVVAGYIFEYINETHFIRAKTIRTDLTDSIKYNLIHHALDNIKVINNLYNKTVLSEAEKIAFFDFTKLVESAENQAKLQHFDQVLLITNRMVGKLNTLSAIQTKEGKSKLATANQMYNRNNNLGQLQIALLIVLSCLTFYLLLIKKPKRRVKIPQAPSMN